jgi:hypothetical protein
MTGGRSTGGPAGTPPMLLLFTAFALLLTATDTVGGAYSMQETGR